MLKKELSIFIITEGGSGIGLGHISRCIAVHETFAERGIQAELIINGDRTARLLSRKVHQSRIFNWLKDRKRLFKYLKGADIVIIDSYLAPLDFYEKISKSAGTAVFFDDYKRLDYPDGIIVNGAVCADKLGYRRRKKSTYLLGSCYIPVRKEFLDIAGKSIKKDVENIMVTFGGNDPNDMTPRVLNSLVKLYPSLVKNVLISKAFKNKNEIKKVSDNKTNLFSCSSAAMLKKVMAISDIAISAGGQTLYELARAGVPTIAVLVAENQLNNIMGLTSIGSIEYAGRWDDPSFESNLRRCLHLLEGAKIRKLKSSAGRELVDGLGAARIAQTCIETHLKNSIVIRKARTSDMRDIYNLSNDKEIRKWSFKTSKISLGEHEVWFRNKVSDIECVFLVARLKDKLLGQVRFDKDAGNAVVNISIAERYRGLGAGGILLRKASRYLIKRFDPPRSIKAFVKEGNTASKRLFESIGFRRAGTRRIKGQDADEYFLNLKDAK